MWSLLRKKREPEPQGDPMSGAEAAPVIATLRKRLEEKPNDALTHKALGNVFCNIRDFKQATVHYRNALAQSPGDADLHCFLGFAYQQMRHYRPALAAYQKAVAIRQTATLFDILGDLSTLVGQHQQALTYYQSSLRHDSRNMHPHFNMAQIFMALGRPKDAIPHLEEVVAKHPRSAQAYSDLGVAWGMAGDHDKALGHLKKALKLEEKNASFHHNMGVVYAKMSKPKEAKICLERALKLDPTSRMTRKVLRALKEGS